MDYGIDGIPRETPLTKATLIKKHLLGVFLNAGTHDKPVWVRVCNATEFTRSMNPETEERDYIADSQPTTELTGYKPSESIAVTAYKGEGDYGFFYKLYKERAIGGKAHRELLLVSLFDGNKIENATKFYAEVSDCTVSVTEYNFSDGTISITLNENGSPTKGWVKVENKKPVFSEGDMPLPPVQPVFNTALADVTYTEGEAATALDGSATVTDGGEVTYSWKKADGSEVATTAVFTPPTDTVGSEVYTVTATNTTAEGSESNMQSAAVTIEKQLPTKAEKPTITAAEWGGASHTVTVEKDGALQFDASATVADGGEVTYSWKKADGSEVATTAVFTPPTDTVGDERYKVTVTNTVTNKLGTFTAKTERSITVSVTEVSAIIGVQGGSGYTFTFKPDGGCVFAVGGEQYSKMTYSGDVTQAGTVTLTATSDNATLDITLADDNGTLVVASTMNDIMSFMGAHNVHD